MKDLRTAHRTIELYIQGHDYVRLEDALALIERAENATASLVSAADAALAALTVTAAESAAGTRAEAQGRRDAKRKLRAALDAAA